MMTLIGRSAVAKVCLAMVVSGFLVGVGTAKAEPEPVQYEVQSSASLLGDVWTRLWDRLHEKKVERYQKRSVPDEGSTLILLGGVVAGVLFVRRKMRG